MTQETAASARFEERWRAATAPNYGQPTIDGDVDEPYGAPEFSSMVGDIAAAMRSENLIGQNDHDKMVACAADIDAVMASVPADRLADVLNRPKTNQGGS